MDPRISRLIDSLPTLTKDDVDIHDNCPICFVDFKTILDDDDSESGITRLVGCSHVFCRKDLIQWIQSWHGSCPTCRNIFISNLYPDSESEDDESDDEEYVPNEELEDEFEEEFEEEEEEEEVSFSFEAEPGEEDDHAIGLGIMDAEFEDLDDEDLMEAVVSQEADAEALAAEDAAAEIEAELRDEDGGFAEPFGFRELTEEVEEEHRRLEAEFLYEEAEECTDLPDWDDSEDLRFSVADSFQPENEEEDIYVEAYEEYDQR